MLRLATLGFIALAAFATPALAQDMATLDTAEQAVSAAWDAAPLGFRKALFVTDATAFGVYTEKGSSVFKSGEPIVVYAEPVGYGYIANADGTNNFGFTFDLSLKSPDGKEVAAQANFAKVEFTSHARNREFLVKLTLDLSDAPAGDYVIEYLAHDMGSEKTATLSLPFSVGE